jgi:serine/threonine protein kinase
MKITNKKSMKEYEIAQEMKTYIAQHKLEVHIIEMVIKNYFVLSTPVGLMMSKEKISNKNYIIQILNQLAVGQQVGYVHRDIRTSNIILYRDEHAYLIDWDSSTRHGFKGGYEGGFVTASTHVLLEYESSDGKQVSAYYADDWVSVIYMVLLCHCSKDDHVHLQSRAGESAAKRLLLKRQEILTCGEVLRNKNYLPDYIKEVIVPLEKIEDERETLTDINHLRDTSIKIIEAMEKLDLVT